MFLIVKKALGFRNPVGPRKIVTVRPVADNAPQKVPEWIRTTPEFKLAVESGAVTEIVIKSAPTAAAPKEKEKEKDGTDDKDKGGKGK
jgi:hypothetical protein